MDIVADLLITDVHFSVVIASSLIEILDWTTIHVAIQQKVLKWTQNKALWVSFAFGTLL